MDWKGILKAVAPVAATFIPGIGPIAGPLLGAALGATGGGGAGGALKGGLAGLTASQIKQAMDQSNADRAKAREIASAAQGKAEQASATANKQFGLNSPLRDAFRFGALNLGQSDSSNPFAKDTLSGYTSSLARESAPTGSAVPAQAPLSMKSGAGPAPVPVPASVANKSMLLKQAFSPRAVA